MKIMDLALIQNKVSFFYHLQYYIDLVDWKTSHWVIGSVFNSLHFITIFKEFDCIKSIWILSDENIFPFQQASGCVLRKQISL